MYGINYQLIVRMVVDSCYYVQEQNREVSRKE